MRYNIDMNKELFEKLNLAEYIQAADKVLEQTKITEHNVAHLTRVVNMSRLILTELGYDDEHTLELSELAGYMHDFGNIVNRHDHAHSSALLAHTILLNADYELSDIFEVMSAVANHNEATGNPISPISAALIIADKADVRRSRVRKQDISTFDIHDRVNYAVQASTIHVNKEKKIITLRLSLDTDYSSVVEYLEIFTGRMKLCKKSAKYLGCKFKLMINDMELID